MESRSHLMEPARLCMGQVIREQHCAQDDDTKLTRRPVQNFGLHKNDRVRVSNRAEQQPLCLYRRTGYHNLCDIVFANFCHEKQYRRTLIPAAPMKKPSGL